MGSGASTSPSPTSDHGQSLRVGAGRLARASRTGGFPGAFESRLPDAFCQGDTMIGVRTCEDLGVRRGILGLS
jgi:hypothetical protein